MTNAANPRRAAADDNDAGPTVAGSPTGGRPRVEIYHKTWCPYSRAALALLDRKGVAYEDIDVTTDRAREQEMIRRSGRTSVPEIFVDGELIGGYDELAALAAEGRFDRLFGVAAGGLPKAA